MNKLFKRLLCLVLTLAMILPSMLMIPFTSAAEESPETEYKAEIMKVKGGASAIATMTFDDGVHASSSALLPLLEKYNLRGTLMVVPSRIMGIAPYTNGYSTISQLRDMMKDGYLEVQSHSYSHLYIADPSSSDYNPVNNTDENRHREIVGSKEWLTDAFPEVDAIAFAVPGGSYDAEAKALLAETFYAVRNGSVATGNMQTLTPMEGDNPMNWNRLQGIWLGEAKIEAARTYLATCVENGGWFISGVHNIVGTEIGKGNYEISTETLEILLADMKAYQDSGVLWVTTFGDATKYLREYESSTVRQYSNAYGMYVEVTMNDTTPGGLPLDPEVFDMPLTVKIEIPEGWENVRLSLNGTSTVVSTFVEGGKTYAYAEIVPNSGAVLISNAEAELPTYTTNAELAMVKGGANAIATLTFDDGLKGTANALNELCAEYDCKASLILITNKLNETEAVYWNNVFAQGYLEPESHSYSHAYIDSAHPENEDQAFMDREIGGSLDDLRKYFPDYDCLAYGTPYSGYTQKGLEEIAKYFYAHRGNGGCVLVTNSLKGKMMGLDPACDTTTLGGWYRSISIRVQPEKSTAAAGYENITLENILAYLDQCVTDGGWFIGSTHGIVDGENLDITIEDITVLMKAMQAYQNENKLWVATYSEATKYIRERQNSEAHAYTTADGAYYVSVTMADVTADGLPLDTVLTNSDGTTRKLFNMPLTVKLEVQSGWEEVEYVNSLGERVLAPTFTEAGRTYAYVDAVPNGETVKVIKSRGAAGEIVIPEPPAGTYTQPEGTYVPEDEAVTYAIWNTEADFLAGNSPVKESTSTTLLNADVEGYGYVHVYQEISGEKIKPVTVDLKVNLGGKAITLPTGTLIENGRHLILANGTVYNKGQLHARAGTYFTVDNCHFINTSGSLGYGWGASRIIYRNSKLELNAAGQFVFLTYGNKSTDLLVKFENTDVFVNAAVSEYGLFKISESYYGETKWTILFDRNSSINGNISKWVSCLESVETTVASRKMTLQQRILFEEGFTFSEGAIPDFTYDFYELSDSLTSLKEGVTKPANGGICLMAVVKPGTTYAIDGKVEYVNNGLEYSIYVPDGTVDLPVGGYYAPVGSWECKNSDITYALWANEAAFNKGLAPIASFTSDKLMNADVAGGGYVHVFRDLVATDKIHPNANCKLVINLAGHQLTTKGGLGATNARVDLTIKNGTLLNEQQFNFRAYAVITFENLHIKNNYYVVGYGASPDKWTFRHCILELNHASSHFMLGGNPVSGARCEIRFEDTDIIVNGGIDPAQGLFRVHATTDSTDYFIITLDKDSSITGNITADVLISCLESAAYVFDRNNTNKLIVEEGFTSSFELGTKYLSKVKNADGTVSDLALKAEGDDVCEFIFTKAGETTDEGLEYVIKYTGNLYELRIIDKTLPETLEWDYKESFAFNGKEHKVELLPGQIDLDYYTVTYTNNAFVGSGKYVATVTVSVTATGEVVRTATIEWEIYSPEMPPIPETLEWDYNAPISLVGGKASVTLKEGQLDNTYYYVVYEGNTATANGVYTAKATVCLAADDRKMAETTLEWRVLYTPAADKLYATWASKADYEAGKNPIGEYSGELIAENIASAGYVRFFGDVSYETNELILSGNVNLTVDLAGYSLTTRNRLQVLDGVRLVIENGTLNHAHHQFYYRPVSYVTFRNLIIDVTTGSNISYGYGCTDLRYENCTVYLNSANNYFCLNGSGKNQPTAVNIINTDFVINAHLKNALFTIVESTWGYHPDWTVNIDKDSSITTTSAGRIPAFLALEENFRYIENADSEYSNFQKLQRINIEEGCELSKDIAAALGEYTFTAIDYEASVAAKTAVYKEPVVLKTGDARCKVYVGDTLVNGATLFLSPNEKSTMYEVLLSVDSVNDGYYIFEKGSNIGIGYLANKNEDGLVKFASADLKRIPDQGKIVMAQDSIVTESLDNHSSARSVITVDLGGTVMTLPTGTRFNLSNYYSGANNFYSVTWQNGTFEAQSGQPWYGGGHVDSVFTFDNVTVNYSGTGLACSIYTGTWVVKNSTFNAPHGIALAFEKSNTKKGVIIENSTINAIYASRMYLEADMRLDMANYYAKNSTFNCSGSVIYSEDNGSTKDSYFVFYMENCVVNSNCVLGVKTDLPGSETVIMSNTRLASEPLLYINAVMSENTDNIKLLVAEGEKLMKVSGIDGVTYMTGKTPLKAGDLQANLTLYADFQLNLFANPDVVNSILVNGKKVDFTVFEGKNKYSVRNITPDTAADLITLTVTATIDGITYTFDVEYSVLSYAKSVIASSEVGKDAKALVSAAMAYVQTAYIYAGKDAPAFDGISYNAYFAEADEVTMPAAIKGAQLDLDSGFKLRFNIAEGYNGTVIVNGTSYEVVNGAYNGITYFEVNMRAYVLADTPVVITSGDVTGEYSLANYVLFTYETGDDALADLADALFTFASHAKAYKAAN